MPDYFREMAERTVAIAPRVGDTDAKAYLDKVAQTYRQLADEADRAFLPFEPARVYAPSLYDDVVSRALLVPQDRAEDAAGWRADAAA